MGVVMISPPHRLRSSIEAFLDQCAASQVAFEPQRAFATEAEANEAGFELWERYCELHRAVGREPPAARAAQNAGTLI